MWGTMSAFTEKEGRFSTAHVYQNALFSFNKFVVMPVYLSGKSLVTDCVVTGTSV